MDNWIFKYHEAIKKKEVIVGVWVRLSFEILTTGLLNGEWEFNEKKANKAIKFMRYTEPTDRRATEKRSCILRKGWGKVESFT